MVGAGAVVPRNVPALAILVGNPARIAGYVDTAEHDLNASTSAMKRANLPASGVRGVSAHYLRTVADLRGKLSVGQSPISLPFEPKRFFVVYDVPSEAVRGEHAHKTCHQFLVCTHGAVTVIVDDGAAREQIVLDAPLVGLHLEPLVWSVQYRFTDDASLLVLASDQYDPDDYIRDYDEFLVCVKRG